MGAEYEFSLQQFIDKAIESEDYDLASELSAQESASKALDTRRMRYRKSLAVQALYRGSDLPRDMDCVDKRSLAFGE